ncbi:phage integrase SAM-like domain-containing protein [Algibacter miyuki]|uniref:Phage integrase SAM-like domain-containing protein n=1 Tax=Algibacter miyuki TaxID=1306933 RepID=A0ABV5H3U1_9FLAO|nr:site-specific integrase [Algibacter miyuki]MDN3665644.1 site-specific integrase [Algibacter miyuki]
MKTTFIPRNYESKDFVPLYLHITGLGKRERLLLDIDIPKKLWSKKKQRVNFNKVEDAVQKKRLQDINLIIDNIDSKIINIKTVYRLSEIVLTPRTLKKELVEDLPRVNFCSFYQHALNEQKESLGPGTFRKLQSVLNKLKDYNDQVVFSELDLNWFEKYKLHLANIGNQKTTINSNIKSIKKFLHLAIKTGIKIPCNMDDIKSGSTLGNRVSLEPYELKKIKKYFDSEFVYKSHKTILGYFLFSCVTGLRFADVMSIRRESAQGDFIQFRAEKVDKMQTITLNLKAKELIAQDETLFVKRFTNEYVNRELKVIMRNLGIKKKVTFHVSRHTFATSFLRAGGKIEKLQLLLGHSDLRQSMIYNHIVAAEANKEIFLLDDLY